MSRPNQAEVTQLLRRAESGDPESARRLFEALSFELREIAGRHFSKQAPGHTLQPTALISEAFLKMLGGGGVTVNDRAHFLALASRVMRQILVNHARGRPIEKRRPRQGGGYWEAMDPDAVLRDGFDPDEFLDLDHALTELAQLDERKARLVELRFFAGLSEVEAAETLGLSRTQAARDWSFTRAWLLAALRRGEAGGETP